MTSINIVCIGKLKEKYWRDAEAEYRKRLGAFCRLRIIEKKESALPGGAPAALIEKARDEESRAILESSGGALIVLSPDGDKMTSEAFAALIKKYADKGDMTFAVGGSYGLSDNIKENAAAVVSFSDVTMPHQLFRIVLIEQVYRAFMIINGRTYHK
ncbi:MAG: 23S rRNA (pseudouridine(1915)-N(3))-methyltransferase RlmH [Eubacteriales bacterium]|nr:23S rRNA (pseudouridine(1915)-N(3))-methyltransferase RlmH [Eubacteriales bacterium]